MRDIIWHEMVHTKYGDHYLAHYLDRQKLTRKWFKILILIFSTSGVLGWKVWEYMPVVACVLIAIIQLISLIENQIIPTDKDIESVAKLRNKYISYFNKLEKLWKDYSSKKLDETKTNEQFYVLRQIGANIEAIDNKLHIRKIKVLCDKADTETRNYFNQYHS
jgi:hypothetical protein